MVANKCKENKCQARRTKCTIKALARACPALCSLLSLICQFEANFHLLLYRIHDSIYWFVVQEFNVGYIFQVAPHTLYWMNLYPVFPHKHDTTYHFVLQTLDQKYEYTHFPISSNGYNFRCSIIQLISIWKKNGNVTNKLNNAVGAFQKAPQHLDRLLLGVNNCFVV